MVDNIILISIVGAPYNKNVNASRMAERILYVNEQILKELYVLRWRALKAQSLKPSYLFIRYSLGYEKQETGCEIICDVPTTLAVKG